MKINIYILLIILLSALSLNAQLRTYEKPPSYSMKSELLKYDDKNIKVMPPIDLAKLLEEDKEEEPRGFATELVIGDESVLEYYTPKEQTEEAIISIDYVVHGYKKLAFLNKYYGKEENELQDYGSSGACQVNVNCSPEGDDWQMEKRAVAMIVVDGHRSCSGSLINNTWENQAPYFLTAHHCVEPNDAIYDPNIDNYSFYWNYETPGCGNTGDPPYSSTSGAVVVANNVSSDFALLRLTEDPKNNPNIEPFYLGWDRSGSPGRGGVCIHHPRGDVKKIATHNIIPITSNCFDGYNGYDDNFWKIYWNSTLNGHSVTEGGSSGSPLINNQKKVIGQLYGAGYCSNRNCSDPFNDIGNYGKFNISWTGNNNPNNRRRLDHWLDPNNSGRLTLDGLSNCREKIVNYNINSNTTIGCDQVKFHNSTINNNAKVMIHTKKLIIQDNFRLESGQKFEVNISPQ